MHFSKIHGFNIIHLKQLEWCDEYHSTALGNRTVGFPSERGHCLIHEIKARDILHDIQYCLRTRTGSLVITKNDFFFSFLFSSIK